MSETRNFSTGISDAIHILSTKFPTTLGRYCSAAMLSDVSGPSMTQKLYISALEDYLQGQGTYEEGLRFAINLMATKQIDRIPDLPCEWGLFDTDNPSVENQLYISAFEILLGENG